ncbi:MAG: hypothetical protein AAF249_03290 [Pseudomonadota bacterium]
MPPGETRPLTKRQAAVMERIDRRVPIKVIAQELGVSETRINQHIRALKDIYGAGSLRDLVDLHRLSQAQKEQAEEGDNNQGNEGLGDSGKPLSEAAYTNSQVQNPIFAFDNEGRDGGHDVELNDVSPLIQSAPWLRPSEPKVVPGLLDGEHAITLRLAAIAGIAFGILAAAVLTAVAALMISEALDGRATVPVNEQGFS